MTIEEAVAEALKEEFDFMSANPESWLKAARGVLTKSGEKLGGKLIVLHDDA